MVVEAQRLLYEGLARATERLAAGVDLGEALELLASAVAEATGSELVIVRVLDETTAQYVARAVAPLDSPLAPEAAGSSRSVGDIFDRQSADTLALPAVAGGRIVAALEVHGRVDGLDATARSLAQLAAAQLGLVLRTAAASGAARTGLLDGQAPVHALEHAGETLAAGAEVRRAAGRAVHLAAEAIGARAAVIWRIAGDRLEPMALHGEWPSEALEQARTLAAELRDARRPLVAEQDAVDGTCTVSIQLGQPPFGVLQLRCRTEPPAGELAALASFAARASHALRVGQRAQDLEAELERTRALLSVVGDAISRLSLAHTLETAVERIALLLGIERVGIYLRDEGRLTAAAERDLPPAHDELAFCLLELALGPLRARASIEVRRGSRDVALSPAARALHDTGAESALAVPLRAGDEPIGLLVAYPPGRRTSAADRGLLSALAAQLAVAVQNARLHEQAKELGDALGAVLDSERQAARQLGALYEISSSFASSLSLETTLATVTTSIVHVLGVDAAAISMPTDRGDTLVPQAVHVADERLGDAVRTILNRPLPARASLSKPLVLDAATARRLGGGPALLEPFLAKGSTAAMLPIATPAEVLAVLTIVSLDPAAPITAETVATATTIAAQAALAIDNARLYQQQKAFAETIQRALLPRTTPQLPGVVLGAVYESAARVDVGGDLYDFLELPDGRLVVVVGDVTGHGVDATADMAMTKFVFRSLAREHPQPGELLAHANEVIAEETAVGKFVTMVCLTLDPDGAVSCACAGHPPPRVVLADGRVESLEARGLALGIDADQTYDEVRRELPVGASAVLYTDGVIEARSGRELYGVERLDELLRERRGLPAQELAEAVLADCRAFAGGELGDDCAVVIVRRT
jgi:GAF domain-containing protein